MKVFNEKYAEIDFDPYLNAVVIKWKDFASPENYQKTIEAAYEAALKNKCPNWISDMTSGKAVSIASVNWLKNTFIPKVAKDGLIRKIAFLIDYNPERKIFAETIKEVILMNGVSFKSFSIRSELEEWIKGQEHSKSEGKEKVIASYSQYF